VAFIGKEVKAGGNTISFDGAAPTALQFSLAAPANAVQISITDSTGRVVRSATTGALASGDRAIAWDGRDNNGLQLPAGAYNFAITATNATGATIASTTYTTGRIDGVSLVSGKPMLTIGAATVGMSDVISIKGV
jgi:flagellar basal-body rod modification protein FlgD